MINFDASNLIIMWYPQFAGGKFIMNCLSLSRHCVPLDTKSCDYLLDHPTDYKYRLDTVLRTLPPKGSMHNWLHYEFNTASFYKKNMPGTEAELAAFKRMHSGTIYNTGIDQQIHRLINKNINFFAESRGNGHHVRQYLAIWPNAKIVKLINFENFQSMAAVKKQRNSVEHSANYYCGNECSEKYNLLKGENWPDWGTFEKNDYNIDKVAKYVKLSDNIIEEIKQYYHWHDISSPIFNIDVDTTYFDKDKFFTQIQDLYDWLGYEDFNETLLSQYYTAYIDLHKT